MILKGVKDFAHPLGLIGVTRVAAKFRMCAIETIAEAGAPAGSSGRSAHALHIFPSFGIGGVPLRMVRIINHLGSEFHHTVVALDENFDAAAGIARNIDVTIASFGTAKRSMLWNLASNARMLRRVRPDLLLTYNWGAIEWAAASRFSRVPRHVHFEAGFGAREADSQITRRVLFRRWALARCELVVVPSRHLETLASKVWRLPAAQIAYIPNGVDTARFAEPDRNAIPGFIRHPGELVIGTVAPLRREKNIARLLRVFAELRSPDPLRLVVAGDGVERVSLESLAADLGIADRVIFTGNVAPEAVLGAFDIFALSSDTEQMPNALLEAMAAARAVAAVDVGDVKQIVSRDNREFIVDRDDASAFVRALTRLLREPEKRRALGAANRRRVTSEFSQERMFSAYSRILSPGQAL
jgi:glycosyltransferase involved in cell wall biosynthesis